MVMIEKKPNANAEAPEKANAKIFLNLSCLITETTLNRATIRNKIPKNILMSSPYVFLLVDPNRIFILLCI